MSQRNQTTGRSRRRSIAIATRSYGIPLEHLRAWRRYRTISQSDLGRAAGLTLCCVNRIENGKGASYATIRTLAAALHITVEALRYEHPDDTQPERPA